MGFGQGLSGLNAAAQNLDVIGNNIANSGTVGFKTASATFADIYAGSRVGLGVQVSSVKQRFTVGNVSSTGNMFDMAIEGEKGMFRLVDSSGAVFYSRNGQFSADKDNYIINAQGQRLTGYAAGAVGTDPVALTVPRGNVEPNATDRATVVANFKSDAPVIDKTMAFDPDKPTTYSHGVQMTVYDSLGNPHKVSEYKVKRDGVAGQSSKWDVYYRLDGQPLDTPGKDTPIEMSFDTGGRLTSPNPATVELQLALLGGTQSPAEPLKIELDYTGTTSFSNPFGATFTQNGYPSGEYAGMTVDKDGSLMANYTNGQSRVVGVLAMATFNNVQGLQPAGGNAWIETSESGAAVLGQAGANGLAKIKGQAVEDSNVDMSQELVNMIIAQRTYQANAQTIKTQDQVLQTLITMR